jgi:hypothetical protein
LGDGHSLQLNYSVDGSETNFKVKVFNRSINDWDNLSYQGDLNETSFTAKEYTLNSTHLIDKNYFRIRFIDVNQTLDEINSTINLEYLRIKSINATIQFVGENSGHNFGWSVGNASDINQDGIYDDLIIGAPNYRSEPYQKAWGSNDIQINNGPDEKDYPDIAVDSNGYSVVVWEDDRDDGSSPGIYAQRLDPNGNTLWGSDRKVNQSVGVYNCYNPDVAIDSDGNAIVVWYGSPSFTEIYAQKLDTSGNPLWGSTDVTVNQNTTGTQEDAAVAVDSAGNAYVVWSDYRNGSIDGEIYAQKLNSSGVPKWGSNDLKVNQNLSLLRQRTPDIAVDSDNNIIVIWEDNRTDSDFDIYAQKYNSDGVALWDSDDILVNQNSGSLDQVRATIGVDPDDNIIVAWLEDRNTATITEVFAQKLSSSGNPLWDSSDKQINQYPQVRALNNPKIAVDSEGYSFIIWDDKRNGIADNDYYLQKCDPQGNAMWGSDYKIHRDQVNNQLRGGIAVDPDDNVIAVWYDGENYPWDIFGQKLTASTSSGRAYIYHGNDPIDINYDLVLTGENSGDRFGYSVSYAGDINNDTIPDVIVGAPYFDKGVITDCGAIYVFCGGADMDTVANFTNYGQYAGDHLGWSVSFALKFNGSGNNTVVVGAPHYDTLSGESPPSAVDAGKVYVLYIPPGGIIPEFEEIAIPITFSLIIFAVFRKKRIKLMMPKEPRKPQGKNLNNNENCWWCKNERK